MKLFTAFLRLIRWPNLVFIALTQVLFYGCIILPVFHQYNSTPALSLTLFILLVIASVLIAAAGYIINDYFDLHIDAINKPGKMVIDKTIKRRWAIVWHWILSTLGILLSIFVGYKLHNFYGFLAGSINILSVGALWLYSTTYKRKLLIGNMLISLLTAWTILVLYVANLKTWFTTIINMQEKTGYELACTKLFKLAILYSAFAFVISLIREVVKDTEDIAGDMRYGCKTMPIVWGVPATKVFVAVWIIVLVAVLAIVQFYVIRLHWWWSVFYCVALIIVPLAWVLQKLRLAQLPEDYHLISTAVKFIMLSGILSILFVKLYT